MESDNVSDEIKPRIDEHGVGWCDAGCPQCRELQPDKQVRCRLNGGLYALTDVCPHHARRQAEWIELAMELSRLGQADRRLLTDAPGREE